MDKVSDLKRITKQVLGRGPGPDILFRVDRMLEEGGTTNASLLAAIKKIESLLKFYVNKEDAEKLGQKYREYLKKNASYL